MYRGLNKAIDICDGKIIGYINADDKFNNKEYFKIIVTTFENKKVECIYSGFEVIDLKANKKKFLLLLKLKKVILRHLECLFVNIVFFGVQNLKNLNLT